MLCLAGALALAAATSCLPDVVTGATAAAPRKKVEEKKPLAGGSEICPARRWLAAVKALDEKRALKIAAEIAADGDLRGDPEKERKYASLFLKEGVPASFLSAPLNDQDFKLWYFAWALKKILRESGVEKLNSDNARLQAIMKLVSARIARFEKTRGPLPWPLTVWVRKYGLCDRMAWLFSEFAYQLGLETRVVYLMDGKGVSPHTICEVRGDDGKVWTADPYSGVLLTDVSIAKLAASEALMRKIWPKRPDWWKALPNSLCWIPAMPQDYRGVNHVLHDFVAASLGDDCPRFGEDPDARLAEFAKLAGKDDEFETRLWFFPIRLMRLELKYRKTEERK